MKALFTTILLIAFVFFGIFSCKHISRAWGLYGLEAEIESAYDIGGRHEFPGLDDQAYEELYRKEYAKMAADDKAELVRLEQESQEAMNQFLMCGLYAAIALSFLCAINEPARVVTCTVLKGLGYVFWGIVAICLVLSATDDD